MLTHGSAWFWKMMDWSTVAIELSFLPSAFSLRAFRTVATLAVFFHAGIHFSMDIFFYQNLLAYAMFVDWERQVDSGWLKQGQAAFDRLLQRVRPWMLPVGGLLVAVVFSTFGNPVVRLLDLFGDGRWLRDSIAAILVVLFALKCIVGFAGTDGGRCDGHPRLLGPERRRPNPRSSCSTVSAGCATASLISF